MLTLTEAQNQFFQKYLSADIYNQLKIQISTTEKINDGEFQFLYFVLGLSKAEKMDQPAILGSSIEKLMSIYSTSFIHFFSSLHQKGIITIRENFIYIADKHVDRRISNFTFTDTDVNAVDTSSDDEIEMDEELSNTVNLSYVQMKILDYAEQLDKIIDFIKNINMLDNFDSLINFAKKYNPEGNYLIREMESNKRLFKATGFDPDDKGIEHVIDTLNLSNSFYNQELKFSYAKRILHSLIVNIVNGCRDLAQLNWSTELGLVKTNDKKSIDGARDLLHVVIESLQYYANRMYNIDAKSVAEIKKLAPRFDTSFRNLIALNGKISHFQLVTCTPESRKTVSPFELFYHPRSQQEVVSDRQIAPVCQYK